MSFRSAEFEEPPIFRLENYIMSTILTWFCKVFLLSMPLVVFSSSGIGQLDASIVMCSDYVESRRCTGSMSCRVCTNCSRCGHCKGGGSCGVCAGGSSRRYTSRTNKSRISSSSTTKESASITAGYPAPRYAPDTNSEKYLKGYLVKTPAANVRSSNSTTARVVRVLIQNESLIFLRQFGSWYYVQIADDRSYGFIHSSCLIAE